MEPAYSQWSYPGRFKRWTDIALTLASLPVALPLGLAICALIKLDSRGPILVKLERLGKRGSCFPLYKFRTMVPNAQELLGHLLQSNQEMRREFETSYKIKSDPRITRVGHWLRKTSLDELPQLLNILRGEMSWVGPRAIAKDELRMYGQWGSRLLAVTPGLTGLWQVSGRSKLTYPERVSLDMRYIDTVCPRLDLAILFRTFPVVISGDGAF